MVWRRRGHDRREGKTDGHRDAEERTKIKPRERCPKSVESKCPWPLSPAMEGGCRWEAALVLGLISSLLSAHPAPNLSRVLFHAGLRENLEVALIPVLVLGTGSEHLRDLPQIAEQLRKRAEFESTPSKSRLCHHWAQPGILGPRAPSGGHQVM